VGTGADYQKVQSVPLEAGRFFTSEEEQSAERVAVLGSLVTEDLFGKGAENRAKAVGQTIIINGQSIKILGVIKGAGGPFRWADGSSSRQGRRGCASQATKICLVGVSRCHQFC
jgi:hypothetical protein